MDYTTNLINVIGTQASPASLTTDYTDNMLTITCDGMESVDLNLYFTSSAANSTLVWKVEFSNDNSYFFGEDALSVSGSTVTHSATQVEHQWTPGSTGIKYKNLTISNIGVKYLKLSFKYDTAGGTLWAEGRLKEKHI